MAQIGETAGAIRFHLDQLAALNGHHEFERLCFEVAKRRIAPNILPATGPVSAGGDGGRDFETFTVLGSGHHTDSQFFALALPEAAVFACSIQSDKDQWG